MRAFVCLFVAVVAAPMLATAARPQNAAAKADVKLVEVVPDLPDFPNALMASSCETGPGDGWTHSWERETRTTASFADVRAFYLDQFAKKGWKVTSTKEKSGKSEWTLSKGASWGSLTLDGGSAGLVKITTEWKTRIQ
jgi:hypothetical protein